MMLPLDTTFRTKIRRTAQNTMWDECQVLQYSTSTTDAYNRPEPTYTGQGAIQCGIKLPAAPRESEGEVPQVDYEIRVPSGTAVVKEDRIQITKVKDELLLNPVTCDIVSEPRHGVLGILLQCKVVKYE